MENVQIGIILVSFAFLGLMHVIFINAVHKLVEKAHEQFRKDLADLIKAWNQTSQTINALVYPLAQEESPRTGHLRGQKIGSEPPDDTGADGDGVGISAEKLALYRRVNR